MRKLIAVMAILLAFGISKSALAFTQVGDVYVQASQFEYSGGVGSCSAAQRSGTSGPFVVATCAQGESFFIHTTFPNVAGALIHPQVTWITTSASAGLVCWAVRSSVVPHLTGSAGGYASLSIYGGSLSTPAAGQSNSAAIMETGGYDNTGSTALSEVAIWSTVDSTNCTTGLEILKCVNQEQWTKVSRVPCGGSELAANADAVQVHLNLGN